MPTGPVVCSGCGCLCDDITVGKASKLCQRGIQFMDELPGLDMQSWSKGQLIPISDAVATARQFLHQAQSPGIAGLSLVTVEAVTAAVHLANDLSAWISPWPQDPIRFWGNQAPDLALSRAELEQDADLIIYLGFENGVDQVQPRHRERHLGRGPGLQRHLLDLQWPVADRLQWIILLRMHFQSHTPLPEALQPVAHALTVSRCIQVFFHAQLAHDDPRFVEQWQHLAGFLRKQRRFGVSLLGNTGKARTVTETLTWLTGYPGPLYFTRDSVLYCPEVGEVDQLLYRQTLDVILWVGMNPIQSIPSQAKQIVIASHPPQDVDLAFQVPCLHPQLDAHIVRGDSVMLRLSGNNAGRPDPMAQLLDFFREFRK